MKFYQLRAVTAIAECGSLRAAARQLNASQPALTRSLGELERELGTAIFERRARGMAPTIAGAAFIRRSVSILSEARRALDEVEQITGGLSGVVVAGLSMTAHLSLLSTTLQTFRQRYPQVELEIIEGNYVELEGGLRSGAIEFYVGPQSKQKLAPDLLQEILFSNARVIVARKFHPLADATSLRELSGSEWLSIAATSRGDEEITQLFEHHGLPAPKVRLRGRSALTLITALQASDLVSMVPMQWLDFEPTRDLLEEIHVIERLPAPPIVLVRRQEMPLTPAATFLLDLFNRRIAGFKTLKC